MNKEVKNLIIIVIAVLVIGLGFYLFMQQNKAISDSQPVDNSKLLRTDSAIIGKTDAVNTLVEFGDYQCPACAAANPIIEKLLSENADKLRVVFRHFPLPQHANAVKGSLAAIAAGKQGKYAEMHKALYEKQKEWELLPDPSAKFMEYAAGLGVEPKKFNDDFTDSSQKLRIDLDKQDGNSLGVNSTPTFYLNGEKLEDWNLGNLEEKVKEKLK